MLPGPRRISPIELEAIRHQYASATDAAIANGVHDVESWYQRATPKQYFRAIADSRRVPDDRYMNNALKQTVAKLAKETMARNARTLANLRRF